MKLDNLALAQLDLCFHRSNKKFTSKKIMGINLKNRRQKWNNYVEWLATCEVKLLPRKDIQPIYPHHGTTID